MGIASTLGKYVFDATYCDLPQEVVTATKLRLLDYLGVALDAHRRMPMKPVIDIFKRYGGKEESTVIGDGSKLPSIFAATVNCAYNNVMDGYRFSAAHPGCVVIPGVLAIAEARSATRPATGQEVILTTALGYEVMLRIGQAMYPSAQRRGFSPTTIHGTIGVAAAVAKLLGLDESRTTHAISITSLLGHGLQTGDRAPHPTFSFQVGKACEAGVMSALAAEAGLEGTDHLFEEGFFPAYSDVYDMAMVVKDLGKTYSLPKTYYKMYGGCRCLHAPADVVFHLKKTHTFDWKDIAKTHIKVMSICKPVCTENPTSGRQAEYSIGFGVALALIYGDLNIDRFTDKNLADPSIQGIMRNCTFEYGGEFDVDYPMKRGASIEFTLKDGRTLYHKLDLPYGEPEYPPTEADLIEKFHILASKTLDYERRLAVIDFIRALEARQDIRDLFPLLKATETR